MPDAVLNLKLTDKDGAQHSEGLPQGILYKSLDHIIEPDTARALGGNFYFRLYHQDETGEELIAIVPPVKATTGKEYTIVVKGYSNDHLVEGILFKKGVSAVLRSGN